MTKDNRKESFVTRIWLERSDNGDPAWRGHIRHVQGEEQQYFEDLSALREFLTQITGVSGMPVIKGEDSRKKDFNRDRGT